MNKKQLSRHKQFLQQVLPFATSSPLGFVCISCSETMELCSELQLVFESAVAGLEAETTECTASAAVNQYYLARSRLRYVQEAYLQPLCEADIDGSNPDLAVVVVACRQLEATYDWAIQRLTTGTSDAGSDSRMDLGTQHCSEQHCAADDQTNSQLELESRDTGGGVQELRRQGRLTMCKDLQDIAKRCIRDVQGSLDEVVGLSEIKQELREAVLLPMHLPHLFTGIRRPQCNLMFHGLPGTGKTMLVEKIAAEAAIPLLVVSPSAILSKWSGDSEKTLRAVFEAASQMAPAIVFIDEIDSLAPARSTGDDLASRRVLTELLIQMTNVTNKPGCLVYVMACTNRMLDCDPALLRRFDRKIEVPLPDLAARQAFFLSTVQRPEISSSLSDDDVYFLANQTDGCTGSDLTVICREAAMAPLRELMREVQATLAGGKRGHKDLFSQAAVRAVTFADFEAAVAKCKGE